MTMRAKPFRPCAAIAFGLGCRAAPVPSVLKIEAIATITGLSRRALALRANAEGWQRLRSVRSKKPTELVVSSLSNDVRRRVLAHYNRITLSRLGVAPFALPPQQPSPSSILGEDAQ